ncbi:threonine-phosphate decarboxylase [uncultured Tateyamaria sp.]|uniref:threonine-phosphate decarboxylase n=1 Tax=Tateyamaria sp. 1078 TaxID=3417464 RepID=UPI002630EE66|nr:threonine-phosphate decarboxylase [uncultured Tateyamaria sp.]
MDKSNDARQKRDHGGGLDQAVQRYGGARADWIDLSTGINPIPYAFTPPTAAAWTALPDSGAQSALCAAARTFWTVPDHLDVLAVPGASAAIAQMPRLKPAGTVRIPRPTYNEHAAAFVTHGWDVTDTGGDGQVLVHPNNPTGHFWNANDLGHGLQIIDESFCDIAPDRSLVPHAGADTIVLKSFGKFWGLAGLRLGFVIGEPDHLGRLAEWLGPWPVSGVALDVGRQALRDVAWADATRTRLDVDAIRMDSILADAGAECVGGTALFRLYQVDDAARWQDRLAQHHIWSRTFPYSDRWLRLGLPDASGWSRLADAV